MRLRSRCSSSNKNDEPSSGTWTWCVTIFHLPMRSQTMLVFLLLWLRSTALWEPCNIAVHWKAISHICLCVDNNSVQEGIWPLPGFRDPFIVALLLSHNQLQVCIQIYWSMISQFRSTFFLNLFHSDVLHNIEDKSRFLTKGPNSSILCKSRPVRMNMVTFYTVVMCTANSDINNEQIFLFWGLLYLYVHKWSFIN